MRWFGGVLSALLLPAALLAGPAAVLVSPAPALADAAPPIGPDQAQALTAQLRDWLRGLMGPAATLPDLRVTAQGDHYQLTVPIDELEGPDKAITANLHPPEPAGGGSPGGSAQPGTTQPGTTPPGTAPAGGTSWSADDILLPADSRFTAKIPRPKDMPGTDPLSKTVDMRVHITIGGQDSRAEFDPSMTTPSTLVMALRGVAIDSVTEGQRQTQHFDLYSQKLALRPEPGGKLMDIDDEGDAAGWRSAQELPNGQALAIGANRITGSAHVVGLDRSQATVMGTALSALMTAPTPERNERLRAVVVALPGLLNSAQFDETIEGIQVALAGKGGAAIDRLHLGWSSAAPGGNLETRLSLGVDGLAIPELPPAAASLAPKHVALGISLSGIATSALNNLALAALTPGANPRTLAPQIDALFANPGATGGPKLGIDTLAFDVGPAEVQGHGSVIALSPQDIRGTARITVTGFDALADRVRTDPSMQRALPLMVLARGLSRTEGQALVWDIVFTPSGITVNGIDPRTLARQLNRPRPHP